MFAMKAISLSPTPARGRCTDSLREDRRANLSSADAHDPSSKTYDLHWQIFISASLIMCFYTQYQFDCDDFQIGPFVQHCAAFDCGNGAPCLGTDDLTDSCPIASSACEWMGVTNIVHRDGNCRTCRGVILKDERRIRGEILLRYTAIDVVEETLQRYKQRMIRRQREPSTNYADWITHQENRIERYEQGILFLASGSERKEIYVAVFLKNVGQRQVDREVGVLEVQHEVLERKRLEAWNDMATILDLNT
ncbi:hypothetical protein BJ875DRAFT_447002 [Amylocarpus encephaloides]|uniref:Uncharacterized protein n=1 Tax=Amylocarpus encephaloides TaxID=45428 RepID=A0A9P8BZP8_9HELO|nr:hypothetical protein BJ875DRAFT_447002 [Amylocarpus encephaloides]